LCICPAPARVIQSGLTSALALWRGLHAHFFSINFFKCVMVSLASFVGSFPCVAFSGSRVAGSLAVSSCLAFLPSVVGFSGSVAVGCACGVDSLVRSAFPSASVFRVSSFLVGGRVARASFARRSAALVQCCAAGGGLLVAFPLGAAPASLRPCSSFAGFGSGTWGCVALALGLGVPVLLVLPAGAFPAPPAVAARFVCLGAAPCGGALWFAK
jgi:hypothetical protein